MVALLFSLNLSTCNDSLKEDRFLSTPGLRGFGLQSLTVLILSLWWRRALWCWEYEVKATWLLGSTGSRKTQREACFPWLTSSSLATPPEISWTSNNSIARWRPRFQYLEIQGVVVSYFISTPQHLDWPLYFTMSPLSTPKQVHARMSTSYGWRTSSVVKSTHCLFREFHFGLLHSTYNTTPGDLVLLASADTALKCTYPP